MKRLKGLPAVPPEGLCGQKDTNCFILVYYLLNKYYILIYVLNQLYGALKAPILHTSMTMVVSLVF